MREKLIDLCKQANDELRLRSGCSTWGDFADHLIANGVTLDNQVSSRKWIPVSERLPEKRETVLVCDVRENYMNAWEYLGRDEWLYDSSIWETKEITHWMPLPEPPKGEE